MHSQDKMPIPRQVAPGFRFSTCSSGDGEDEDVVTVLEVTHSHVLLESSGEWSGWRPLELVSGAIAEASGRRSLRKLR